MLVGLMGAGKSTVGRALAARLHRPFVDNDTELLRRRGATAAAVVADLGVDALHDAEAATARAMLRSHPDAVVALAASTVDDALVRDELRAHTVVWLRAQPATLDARVRAQGEVPGRDRPSAEQLHATPTELHEARAARLGAVAAHVVDVDGRPVDAVVDEIVRLVDGDSAAGDEAVSPAGGRGPGPHPAPGCAPS